MRQKSKYIPRYFTNGVTGTKWRSNFVGISAPVNGEGQKLILCNVEN